MAIKELKDSDGKLLVVKDGAGHKVTGECKDYAKVQLNKAALLTLTMTLRDGAGAIVNSRNAMDIKDANGGVVATNGDLTLYLTAADNTLVDSTLEVEKRILTLTYTWNDGVAVADQVGIDEYLYAVDKTGDAK